ncbi:MAG TPA: trypsin-like peptidase domain-containing protein [Casimicrobiaceae bacterium]|nr:trypsin-like peptidase domain-containing protein [Casimicrobiaceae bacterium]
MRSGWLVGAAVVLFAAGASAQIVAVPPAANRAAAPAEAQSAAKLLVPAGAPTYAIDLGAPSTEEQARLQGRAAGASNAMPVKRQLRAIGFSRQVPGGDRPLPLASLPWQALADGGKGAQIVVHSPGAAAMRLGLRMASKPSGVMLRFAGSDSAVYGPYAAPTIARERTYWSPVLDGEFATLEIDLPPGVAPESVELRMPKISHLVRAGLALLKSEPVQDIGRAGSCEVDVACVGTPAALNQARSVAKLVFTDDGGTFLCTGTLLNDSAASNTPYLYTASHCIDSQDAASSLITYWFFDAVACGSLAVPPYVAVEGGAQLLGRSVDSDWALVRLNNPPPANALFSAWRADMVADGTAIAVEHHPNGDLKKISQGTMPSYYSFSDGTSFTSARYSTGSTEAGSSGSGLLTLGSGGGFYELRGGLFAGNGSCSRPNGIDVYSRLDVAMPLLAQYLTPGAANPGRKVVVVEYYYAGFDDYFITADQAEIQGLDSGAHPGWVRTGLSFLAYSDPAVAPAGAQPVCRFYLLPQYGDSHFYSADPAECAATAVKFAGSWAEESAALFYIQVPDPATNTCPANTRPVYRFVNRTNQIHHRYTAEVDVRNCMYYGFNSVSDKDVDCSAYVGPWVLEGSGAPPDAPIMCSPLN